MKLPRILSRMLGIAPPAPARRRRSAPIITGSGGLFEAAKVDRFNIDWLLSGSDVNAELYYALEPLRARSRELAANNSYMRRWLNQCRQNIIGHGGIRMHARVRTRNGLLDDAANTELEAAWRRWIRKGSCEISGRLTLWMLELVLVETLMRDGEFLCEQIVGAGPEDYSLRIHDADRLDHRLNQVNPETGNLITLGIEQDDFSRPVAYWMLTQHPGAFQRRDGTQQYERITADRMMHLYIMHRPEQIRGIPAAHAAMLALRDLGQWRAYAIIAAKLGASKAAWWKMSQPDSGVLGEDEEDSPDGPVRVDTAGAGEVGVIYDPDAELIEWNPNYPHGEAEDFNRLMLQGIAGGLGTFYPSLGNDFASINLSSIRGGMLDERDGWRVLQRLVIEQFHQPLFRAWLRWQVQRGRIGRAPSAMSQEAKLRKLDAVEFRARGWSTPDPLKDAQADAMQWGMATKTLRQIIEDRGDDADDLWRDYASEMEALAALGITPSKPDAAPKGTNMAPDEPGEGAMDETADEDEAEAES